MTIFDIVLHPLPVGHANYARPCVVIDANAYELMAVSTKAYEKFNVFTISKHHPDFSATNLTEESYVLGSSIVRANRARTIRKIGVLSNKLGEEFADWLG